MEATTEYDSENEWNSRDSGEEGGWMGMRNGGCRILPTCSPVLLQAHKCADLVTYLQKVLAPMYRIVLVWPGWLRDVWRLVGE